jgi:hypothetical protein
MTAANNQITAPRVDFLDERTGKISREWYMFLYNLYTITGSGSGITAIQNGGTGLSTLPTDGQLLIGNAGAYSLNTLTAGRGIAITNGPGAISIAAVFTAPVTKTADYTIADTDTWIINNKTGSAMTLTFPAASAWIGRYITVKNMQAQLVNSASANIVSIDSTTAGTAILLNVVGNWATMVSDGTNWVIMQAASNNNLLLE